jgi:hypothetical protein
MPAPFPINPVLTSIAIAYRNPSLIADQVFPRVPVAKESFKYLRHAIGDGITIPNTMVGRRGRPAEVEFSATEQSESVGSYGLEFSVPYDDIDNAKDPALNYDPLARATEFTSDLVALDREQRAANVVFNPASYAAANVVTLTGAGQWSDPASDPVRTILMAMDAMLVRPNVAVFGRATATYLQMHPKVVAAVYAGAGNAAMGGIVGIDSLATLLGLQKIIIGEAHINAAKPGQTVSRARLWGKHAAFLYLNPQAMPQMGVTFGLTAQWRTRFTSTWEDRDIGLRGGVRGRVGESVKELVLCNDAGYFVQNAVA